MLECSWAPFSFPSVMNSVPSKCICWSPNPQGDGVWRWGFREVTKFRGVQGCGHVRISALIRKGMRELATSFFLYLHSSRESHVRSQHSGVLTRPSNPKERVIKDKLTLLVSYSWTFSFQNWWLDSCYLSHPVSGVLWWQPELTKTLSMWSHTDYSF